jgi:hypothetical protein
VKTYDRQILSTVSGFFKLGNGETSGIKELDEEMIEIPPDFVTDGCLVGQ